MKQEQIDFIRLLAKDVDNLKQRVLELETQSIGLPYEDNDLDSTPAKYKRITSSLIELQAMYNSSKDDWPRNFIQSILDFTGQTVTEKQLKVLKDLSEQVEFEKELVTER